MQIIFESDNLNEFNNFMIQKLQQNFHLESMIKFI